MGFEEAERYDHRTNGSSTKRFPALSGWETSDFCSDHYSLSTAGTRILNFNFLYINLVTTCIAAG
jgi:hypothetical protein